MGKKLRGVKSVQDFFTEGDQNAGVDFLQYLNTYGDKSTSKTKLFKITKLNRAAKGASKEELDFIENEIQKEQEFEKVLQEQEEQVKLQERISKLSPENQAIYSEWKKKGVDKLDEIEKYQNVEKTRNNPKTFADKLERYSEENVYWNKKGKGFGESIVQTIMEGVVDVADSIYNIDRAFTGNSFYEKNKRESNRLYDKLQKPLIEEKQKINIEKLSILNEKRKKQQEEAEGLHGFFSEYGSPLSLGYLQSKVETIINPYDSVIDNLERENEKLEDIKNSKGFWSGLYDNGLVPSGWKDLEMDLSVLEAAQRQKEGKPLNDIQKTWLDLYESKQKNEQLFKNTNKNYHTGEGVRQSLNFLLETVATADIGSIVSKGLREGAKVGMKRFGKEILKDISEETLERVGKRTLLDKAILGATGTIGLGVQSQIMPNTYTTAIEKKLGNDIQIIEDENGNSKVVVGKKQKENILEKAHYSLLNLENKEKQIEGTLQGEAKQQALAKIQKEKDRLYAVLDQIGTPKEDMDYANAHLYGSIQTLGELFSEKYVGRGLDELGIGRLASKLPGAKKLGSLYDSGKGIVNKLYSKAIGTAEDTFRHKVGSITAQALKHTGKSGQIIHSLPSEIGEEIFTQLIPNNLDNYDEQIAQLADPNFYKDIALQTLIMGGGFGAIGVAGNLKHHKNMLFNKEYAEAYKELQNVIEATKAGYKALNKNLNNDKFAEILTQASSKGIYNLEDRMKNIISLEADGKTKQALHIAEAGITNMMHQAITTGTQSEFVESLRNIVNNKESEFIPESLKQAAKNVFERKGIYEQIYNKYNSLPNFGEIYHTASDIEDSKISINKLQQENQKHLPKVLETIEKLKEQGKIDKDFSLDFYDFNNNKKSFHEAYYGENQTGGNLNTEEVKNYAKDVDTIEEALGLEDAADYFANLSGIEVAEAFISLQTQKLREITSEEYQGRFLNKYISEQIDNIEDKKSLEELLKIAQEKGVVTPELIEQAQQRQEEIENGLPPQNRVKEKIKPPTETKNKILDNLDKDVDILDKDVNVDITQFKDKKVIHNGKEYTVKQDKYSNKLVLENEDEIIEPTQKQINSLKLYETPYEQLSKKYKISNVDNDTVTVNNQKYEFVTDEKGNVVGLKNNSGQTITNQNLLLIAEIERNKVLLKSPVTKEEIDLVEEILEENPYAQTLLNGVYGKNMTNIVDEALEKLYDEKQLTEQERLSLYLWLEEAFVDLNKLRVKRDNILYKKAEDNLTIIAHLLYGNKQQIEKIQKSSKTNENNSTRGDSQEGEKTRENREKLEKKFIPEPPLENGGTSEDFEESTPVATEVTQPQSSSTVSQENIDLGKQILENLRKELKREPSFEDFANDFIESHGKQKIKRKFDGLVNLAESIGLDVSNAKDYYNITFGSIETPLENGGNAEDFESPEVTPEQLKKEEKKVTKEVANLNPVNVTINPENGGISSNDVEFSEEEMGKAGTVKIATGTPKLAFNFTGTRDKEGNWSVDLNNLSEGYMGNRAVLDADYMYEVVKSSIEKPGSVYVELDESRINEIPSLKKKYDAAKTDEERLALTPIVIYYNNGNEVIPISFGHDEFWYDNPHNVANEATKIQGKKFAREIRKTLKEKPNVRHAVQLSMPRGVQYNSTNKTSDKSLLPVSARNSQATIGFAKYTNLQFSYENVPEDLKLSGLNAKTDDRVRVVNIDSFEADEAGINRNNPVIFHKVGVDMNGKNLYMINTLLSPYTYESRNETEKNLGNFKLPEDLRRTFEKTLLSFIAQNYSNKTNSEAIKTTLNKVFPQNEQDNKEIKKLGTNINSLNGFIRIYNQSNSRVHEGPEKNTSAGFLKELKDLKSKGKKNTVFREFNDKGKITTEMAFWDEQAKDYRVVNLNSLNTKLLEQEGNKTFPSNFEELLNKMVAAMSVININATSPKASSRIVTNSGIVVKQNSEVYKDILLTPLVSYEMENMKGEKTEVFNIQPVIHFNLINSEGNTVPVTSTQETTQSETEETINQPKIESTEKSELESFIERKEEFLQKLVATGLSEELALQQYNIVLKNLGANPIDFESRNNINVVQELGNEDTLKIQGITVFEQSHLISYLKNQILSSESLKKVFNKKKLTLEATQEISRGILNSLDSIRESKERLQNTEKVLQEMGVTFDANILNLISKYERILENKDKIQTILKQEIEALDIDIDETNESELNEINTAENFDKTNGEQNVKMAFGFSLKASLFGFTKKLKNNQEVVGLLGLPEYYNPDEILDKILSVVTSTENNFDTWLKAFENKYNSSIDNNKILYNTSVYLDIKNYLKNLPEERRNELMYNIGSLRKLTVLKYIINPQYENITETILEGGVEKTKKTKIISGIKLQTIDENSSKENLKIRKSIFNGFTNPTMGTFTQIKDGKLVLNKAYVKNVGRRIKELIEETNIDKKYNYKTLREIFDLMGLQEISDSTVQYISSLKLDKNNIKIYSENGLFKPFLKNLENILLDKDLDIISLSLNENNPFSNLTSLKSLIALEVDLNRNSISPAIRAGDKTLQGTLQTSSIYDITNRFLNDSEREKALEEYGKDLYTKNSIFLQVIAKSEKFKNYFEIAFNSPEAMKMFGTNSGTNSDIDELSNFDRLVFYMHSLTENRGNIELEKNVVNDLNHSYVSSFENEHLNFRINRVPFLTLSDKGRVVLIPSIAVNLPKNEVNIVNSNLISLGDSTLNYVYNTVLKGELERIIDTYKNKSGNTYEGYAEGKNQFQSIASLNGITLEYENNGETLERNIHEVIYLEHTKNGEVSSSVLSEIETKIKEAFQEYVKEELKNKVKETSRIERKDDTVITYEGELVDSGILRSTVLLTKENKIISKENTTESGEVIKESMIKKIDTKMLSEKSGDNEVEQLQHATVEFIVNSFVTMLTNTQIFLGDPAFYHKSKVKINFDNNGKITSESVETLKDPVKLVQLQQDIASNIQKRSASVIAPGSTLANSSGNSQYATEMIHIAVQDVEMHSLWLDAAIRNHYGTLTLQQENELEKLKKINSEIQSLKEQLDVFENDNIYKDKQASIEDRIEEASKIGIVKNEEGKTIDLFEDLRDYFKVTGTDAQEYATWRTHLDTLFRKGEGISREMFENLTHKLSNDIELTQEELSIIFQPIKPVYTGVVFDKKTNKMRPVYIKSSVFPLLPQWVKGTPLDNVRKNLESLETIRENGMIDRHVRMSYQTANKIGAKKSALTMNYLYGATPEQFKQSSLTRDAASVLPLSNWKIQQETPSKEEKYFLKGKDSRITLGSQFFKGIMGNFINHIETSSFNGIFNQHILDLAGIDKKVGEKLTGQELDKIYTKTYEKYSNILTEQLEKELNLEEISDYYSPNTTQEQKLAILKSIQKLLRKEITRKGYPSYLKDAIDLIKEDVSFRSVLMFDNNRHKFEAMLQSIIANRLIVHTLPGNSHISGSSEGFMKKRQLSDLNAEDKSNIVWLNGNATGELKATYLKDSQGKDVENDKGEKILVEAEIAIPSHFKFYNRETNNYEYVDLTKEPYSIPIKNEQGETTGYVLNKDMISEEMLSNFGFRIPTSSHQSGTILKVVAFLPRNVGDLVLVPKEQTTQLGEDYDVDKRYMYKANYIVDETGKIRELAPEDFELFKSQELSKKGKQDLLEEELENLKIKRKDLYDQIKEDKTSDNLLKAIFGEESFQEGINEVKEEIKEINAKLYLSKKINEKLRNEFEIKLLENSMINTYKAVYTSNDINVQKKIYKPLVTDVANNNAQVINKARNAGRDNANFSLFSDTYQRYLMQLGADGKGGIGVHSNGVVNLSQLQRLSEDRKLKLGWFTPSSLYQGQVISAEFKKFEIKFNSKFLKNNFEGTVGKEIYTLDGKREVAEQPGENQNVSTDNINKGIMVLRNENSHTLSTYNMMAVMGIDQSNDTFTYTDENGQKKEMYLHIPSFFHSQPIMIDYVRLKEGYSSIDAEFLSQEQIQELVIKDLLDKYGNYSESDYNVIFQNEGFTSQLLYDLIKDPNYALQKEPTASGIVPNEVQWAILNTILGIKEQSDKMDRVRKLANLSTSKLGISYFETIAKDTTLRNLTGELKEAQQALASGEIGEYNNWLNILGNFEENEPRDLTIEGIQLLNALKISKKVLPILFNYENSNLLNGGLIDKLFKIQGKDFESVSKSSLKERYQIMSDFSNFVNSGMNAFEGNTISELTRLTKDSETHRGLGYILQDLRNKRNPIMENYLLKDLELTTDPNSGVTLIKHTAQDVSTLANSNKIDAFLNLLIDDTVLGIYNGEELTVSNLAKDLVSYSILADNQNGATGFRQFIPTSYLEAIGFNQNLRNFSKKFSNEYLERMQDLFIEQYLQHNPDKIKFKDVVKGSVKLPSGIKEEDKPLYALERISKSKKRIWKYNKSTKSYEEIPLLGSANTIGEVGINEYDFNNSVRRSVYTSEQQKVTPIYIKDSNTNTLIGRPNDKLENYLYTGNLNNFFRSEEMLKGDANAVKAIIDRLFGNELIDSLNPEMNAIWEVYKNYINKDLKIKFEIPTGYENTSRFDGVYRHNENTIYINPNVFRALYNDVAKESKDGKVDILKVMDKFKTLMMEEVLHSIQVSHLQKGWNTPQGKSIREKYQKALTLGITNPYLQNTGNELVDVAEFIAGIYASPELRQDLEKADKGFIDRFLYSLKRLLQELIPGKGFETIHHNMIEMVKQNFGNVNFLESQQVAQEVKEVKKELSPSEKLNEIRKDEVQVIPLKDETQKANLPTSSETINIYAGDNQNAELSNFAIRPFTTNVEFDEGSKQIKFQSVEQGFHFYKALVANNPQVAKQILATTNGGQLKRLTNRNNLKMSPEQVKEWDDTSKSIMLNLMYDSYAQNPKAAEKLLATGNAKITHEGPYKPDRWTKDFPEVVMTVRGMLKEEGLNSPTSINTIKEGVTEVFKNTPELASIGTQEQYSQYLDTIFPDSKVKDIVYHGSPNIFDEFSNEFKGKNTGTNRPIGVYFTPNNKIADFLYQGTSEEKFDEQGFIYREKINSGKVYAVLLNFDYIKEGDNFIHEKDQIDEYDTEGLLEYDAYVAKNKEQIHILGSKQDIEGFKNFIENLENNDLGKQAIRDVYKKTFGNSTSIQYSDFGTKTASKNVKIDPINGRKPTSNKNEIVAYRGPNTASMKNEEGLIKDLEENRMIGNPFGPYGLVKINDTEQAVMAFYNWLNGTAYQDKFQNYKQAILDKANEMKGLDIIYYKDLGQPSHATALDYFLNNQHQLESNLMPTIGDSVPKYEVNKNLANKDGSKRFAQNSGTITSKENPMQIYVDGSDIKGTGAIGYGAYAEYNNKTYELSGTNESDSVKELQKKFPQATFSNPTMEMLGLLETLKKFATTSEHIVINQDYKGAISYGELWNRSEGSEQRPDKPWNAKEAYIKDIVDQSVDIIKQIESNGGSVKINWVKGHQTGTSIHKKGNDNADRVAKDRNIKDTFDEFNNTDFESRDNLSNFAEEAFECK